VLDYTDLDQVPVLRHNILALLVFQHHEAEQVANGDFGFVFGHRCQLAELIDDILRDSLQVEAIFNPLHQVGRRAHLASLTRG